MSCSEPFYPWSFLEYDGSSGLSLQKYPHPHSCALKTLIFLLLVTASCILKSMHGDSPDKEQNSWGCWLTSRCSALPSAFRITSGLRKQRPRSLPARILGSDTVLALTLQSLLPCSCVPFPSLSLSSSTRLLGWFLFC